MNGLEGVQAPAFELRGSDGLLHSPAGYRGRVFVLYFYPRDNTPGCTKEVEGFRDLYAAFQAVGVDVLGVSKDSLDSHHRFIEKLDIPFILLSDPTTEMMSAYGAFGEKVLYGKKSIGVIRSTVIVGADGVVLKHWRRVPKAADHAKKVFEIVQKLKG